MAEKKIEGGSPVDKNKPDPNYFFVNRALLYSDRWLSEPFTRGQAWIDLFGLAQHGDGFFRVRGIKVNIQRGQLAYSQVTLAKRWEWSRNKVRRYLKELEKEGNVKQQNNEVTTIITILNYDKWQGIKPANDTANDTAEGQQKDSRKTANDTHTKNDKNDKNDKKGKIGETSPSPLKYFYSTFKEKRGIIYVASFAKDGAIFRDIGKVLTAEEIRGCIDKFFDSDDAFIRKSDYGVGVFKTQINKLRQGKSKRDKYIYNV